MKFWRRRYIVNAGLQMKITLVFVLVTLVGSIAATIAFNYFAMKDLEAVMWSTHISVKNTGEIIRPLFVYVNIIDFIFVFVMLIIAVIWMKKKTSGPLFRMSKDISKAADGDLSAEITLRRKDEFQDTAKELNDMIFSVRERYKRINEKHTGLAASIELLKKESENREAGTGHCESVLESVGDLKKELESFAVDRRA